MTSGPEFHFHHGERLGSNGESAIVVPTDRLWGLGQESMYRRILGERLGVEPAEVDRFLPPSGPRVVGQYAAKHVNLPPDHPLRAVIATACEKHYPGTKFSAGVGVAREVLGVAHAAELESLAMDVLPSSHQSEAVLAGLVKGALESQYSGVLNIYVGPTLTESTGPDILAEFRGQ